MPNKMLIILSVRYPPPAPKAPPNPICWAFCVKYSPADMSRGLVSVTRSDNVGAVAPVWTGCIAPLTAPETAPALTGLAARFNALTAAVLGNSVPPTLPTLTVNGVDLTPSELDLSGAEIELSGVLCLAWAIPSPTWASSIISKDNYKLYLHSRLVSDSQYQCAYALYMKESRFDSRAVNGSHYGIPQLRNKKLKNLDGYTQIDWGIRYIAHRYKGDYCLAWQHFKDKGWH